MLDPWIIEEIRRREGERRDDRLPAVVELPIHAPTPDPHERQQKTPDDRPPRGIEIIEFFPE